jgi:beta-phosphoglucomutase
MYKAAIFDMDGVLVDNHHYHQIAWKEFCEIKNIPFTDEEFRVKYFGKNNCEILSGLMSREVIQEEADMLGEEKEALYRKIYGPFIKPVDGLKEFLIQLKAKGFLLAVATSAGKLNLNFVIEALGLNGQFHLLVDASFVERSKPYPDIYLKTAELLGVMTNNCIVFEDSVSGINAAKAAGMDVIGLLTTHKRDELPAAMLFAKDFTDSNIISFISTKLNE